MTFADLYHLHEKCMRVEKAISLKDPYIDEEGNMNLAIMVPTYQDLKDILLDCKALVYDLCQTKVEDVIKRDT